MTNQPNETKQNGRESGLPDTACYARPRTRGQLAVNIREGIESEVVTSNVDITRSMIDGWLNMGGKYDVRPSENAGWSVFFPA